MSKTYYSDGNTADYSKDFRRAPSRARRAPSPAPTQTRGSRTSLVAWYKSAEGATLKDFSYGAESYDATILAALAATKGGSNDSATVQKNFAAVSGATDGEECTTYTDCVTLLEAGKEIRYSGPSGIGPINEQNDPSSAFVGIYTYDNNNKNIFTTTVEGSTE